MRKYWPVVLTVVLLIACGWLFTLLFEQYEEEIDVGYSKEARLNPYLAAQYFLEKNDVKVEPQTSVLDFSLVSANDTVILPMVDTILLTEKQIEKALAWVEQGGVLIVGVGSITDGHDSLLHRFDIDLTEDEKELDDTLNDVLDAIEGNTKQAFYPIHLADGGGKLSVQVLDDIVLNHPDIDNNNAADDEGSWPYTLTAVMGDDNGAKLLQFDYGKGRVTALSSTDFWENDFIGEADHAYLLAYLVPEGAKLHLFYNITAPSLWDLLKRYFSELLIACAALLLLWLWRVGLRVQGIRTVADGQRRVFAEHLTASAEFLASKKQYQSLLMPIKEDITARMLLVHPGFAQLDENEQNALIAQRAEVSEMTIQNWIKYTSNTNSQDELIHAIKLGNAIRRKL